MEPEDKIFEQFKSAAQKAENNDFPAMDKIWKRVEDKLDHKILTKQNTLWKKIAVAASIMLIVSIGYHLVKDEKKFISPKNEIVTIDTIKTITDSINQDIIVQTEEINPSIKPNAEAILNEQITSDNEAVIANSEKREKIQKIAVNSTENPQSDQEELIKPAAATSLVSGAQPKNNYQTRSVVQNAYQDYETKSAKKSLKKDEPLFVIDNKAEDIKELGSLNPDEVDSILVLPDPLYIINGVEYTEQELFGPKPTSPYAPLNKQEIETISILQNEKATSIYGDKGKKGVVIITTKGGKSAAKKAK